MDLALVVGVGVLVCQGRAGFGEGVVIKAAPFFIVHNDSLIFLN